MQEILPLVLTIMLSVLTLMMVVVGVLAIQVLLKIRKTLDRVNSSIELVEDKLVSLTSPLHSIGGMAMSMKTGMKVFESFLGWVNRNKRED
jgi:uncharacterized protein YoxC